MTEKSKYVRFDWAIKRILRDKANKEVLEGLITVLLGEPIKITEILESEGNADAREDKMNRVDVKAKTEQGEYIIVEVQLTKEWDFFQRILFGTAKSITDQISLSQDYQVIKKVYSINILYFDFGSGEDYAYHGETTFKGMTKKDAVLGYNTSKEEAFIDKSRRRVTMPGEVFPEFFILIVDKFNEVARTPIEEWMRYLKDAVIRDDTTVPGLQAAREKLAYMSMTEKERRAYEDYMISVHAAHDVWDNNMAEAAAKGREEGLAKGLEEGLAKGLEEGLAKGLEEGLAKGLEEGLAKGLEEGLAKGLEEGLAKGREEGLAKGREEGLAKGREEGRAKGREDGLAKGREEGRTEERADIARHMKAEGLPVELIAKYTGLPAEVIISL